MTGSVQEGKDEMEWDAAETEAFCLNSDMPLAVVHPCKSPEVIHKVCNALRSLTILTDAASYFSVYALVHSCISPEVIRKGHSALRSYPSPISDLHVHPQDHLHG